jgi:hypothetical protein
MYSEKLCCAHRFSYIALAADDKIWLLTRSQVGIGQNRESSMAERQRFSGKASGKLDLSQVREFFYSILPPFTFLNDSECEYFERLKVCFESVFEPFDFLDYCDISKLAYNAIEISRLQRSATAIFRNPVAFAALLKMLFPDGDQAVKLAFAFFGDDLPAADKASVQLREIGLARAQIEDLLGISQLEHQQQFRQLTSSIDEASRRIRKDIEQRVERRSHEKLAAAMASSMMASFIERSQDPNSDVRNSGYGPDSYDELGNSPTEMSRSKARPY